MSCIEVQKVSAIVAFLQKCIGTSFVDVSRMPQGLFVIRPLNFFPHALLRAVYRFYRFSKLPERFAHALYFFIHYWLRHFLINCVCIVNRHCIAQYIRNVCWKGSVGRAPVATAEKLSKRLEHSRTFSFSRINKVACRGRFSIVQTTLQNVV